MTVGELIQTLENVDPKILVMVRDCLTRPYLDDSIITISYVKKDEFGRLYETVSSKKEMEVVVIDYC